MKRIWMFHLLNDFSGSPLVLKNSALALKDQSEITICTSSSEGFLSSIEGVSYQKVSYTWSPSKISTLINFIKVQFALLWLVISNRSKIDVVYVNTLLPMGAAIGGLLTGKKVIYHLHEPQVNSTLMFWLMLFVAYTCGDKYIFVSKYLQTCFPKFQARGEVVYNVLNEEFKQNIKTKLREKDEQTVLMLCSFKEYKGVYDFIDLADMNPLLNFELVLNSDQNSILPLVEECIERQLSNIAIYPATKDVHEYFSRSRVVLNLSHPDKWVESFGMTALEAMAYGKPCIVPEVGGIAEVVSSNCGYHLSHTSKAKISDVLCMLYHRDNFYDSLSARVKERSEEFKFANYKIAIINIINGIK